MKYKALKKCKRKFLSRPNAKKLGQLYPSDTFTKKEKKTNKKGSFLCSWLQSI